MNSGVAVFKAVLRTLQYIYRNRRAKVIWSSSRQAKIAILDATSAQFITPLCGAEKFEVIHVHDEQLHLTLGILWSAFKWTIKTGQPQAGYAMALLERIRVVATYRCHHMSSLWIWLTDDARTAESRGATVIGFECGALG